MPAAAIQICERRAERLSHFLRPGMRSNPSRCEDHEHGGISRLGDHARQGTLCEGVVACSPPPFRSSVIPRLRLPR